MRICFIADSSSIHVQRMVSHFLGKKDHVLVLSSAAYRADIPGAKVVHLLSTETPSFNGSSNGRRDKNGFAVVFKSLFSPSLKFFIKVAIRTLALLRKRMLCIDEIDRFSPEVIYCFRSFPEGILASRCHVKPLLLRTAGSDISQFPKYPLYRQMIRKALRTADVVVTESLWESKLIHDLCGYKVAPKVSVIGINTDRFRPALSRDDLRDRYGLPRDAFVVITNRYLDKPYNGWLVLKSIESILEQCDSLILLYVSPVKMDLKTKARTESIVRHLPRIRFLDGPRPYSEVPDILGCGDIYISFSSVDGIPNSLLEAMACGLVPVVAELPQFHEWIEHEKTGYFVQQRDVKGLASVISNLYNNRGALSEIASRCVEQIREHGSYEECMDRTKDLLTQLVNRVALSNEERAVSRPVDISSPGTASANQD